MSECATSAKATRTGLRQTMLYCERCDFLESDQCETILTCDCKRVRFGNMDKAFKEAIRQVELLHESNVD